MLTNIKIDMFKFVENMLFLMQNAEETNNRYSLGWKLKEITRNMNFPYDDIILFVTNNKLNEDIMYISSIIFDLNESDIDTYMDYLHKKSISEYQKLSEEFMTKFKGWVDMYIISYAQELSEDFMRDNKSSLDWLCISRYQALSPDFIFEFINYIHWDKIRENDKVSQDFVESVLANKN